MNYEDTTKEELILELRETQKKNEELKTSYNRVVANQLQLEDSLRESKQRLSDITFSIADWV